MNIRLLSIGKTNLEYASNAIGLYSGRIKHYVKFDYEELPEVKGRVAQYVPQQVRAEGDALLKQIQKGDWVVLFDEKGKEMDSLEFARMIEKYQVQSVGQVVFVIGGAYGFSEDMYARANAKISLSQLTFNHQLARVVALEQLYRACTIIRGEPYHHV